MVFVVYAALKKLFKKQANILLIQGGETVCDESSRVAYLSVIDGNRALLN